MVEKNWNSGNSGEEFIRHKLPSVDEDGVPVAYTGIIEEISEPYEQPKFQSEGVQTKITIKIRVLEKSDANNKVDLPMFLTFIKTKGSGAYSNSKLYDVLDTAGLLKESEGLDSTESKGQLEWLRNRLCTLKAKFLIKTVKKGTPDAYSVVDKIVKIWKE